MENVKLVATDMDHTLLTEKNELPPNLFKDIDQLHDLGVEFAIASGRPVYTLESIFGKLKSEMTFISDNGGVIVYHGEMIFMSEMPVADYQKMTKFALEKTKGVPVICGLDAAYIADFGEKYDSELRKFYTNINYVSDMSKVDVKADKFTIYFPNSDSEIANSEIFYPEFGQDYAVVISGAEWIDVMNQGVNKGSAMKILGEKLGITADQMMAFGDLYNDQEMLEYVGYSYAVKNSVPKIKEVAKFETESNDDYGVTNQIERLIAAIKKAK